MLDVPDFQDSLRSESGQLIILGAKLKPPDLLGVGGDRQNSPVALVKETAPFPVAVLGGTLQKVFESAVGAPIADVLVRQGNIRIIIFPLLLFLSRGDADQGESRTDRQGQEKKG